MATREDMCRLCGCGGTIMLDVFDSEKDYIGKIQLLVPDMVFDDDTLPNTICYRCAYKLDEFFYFRTTCESTERKLKSQVLSAKQNNAFLKQDVRIRNSERNADLLQKNCCVCLRKQNNENKVNVYTQTEICGNYQKKNVTKVGNSACSKFNSSNINSIRTPGVVADTTIKYHNSSNNNVPPNRSESSASSKRISDISTRSNPPKRQQCNKSSKIVVTKIPGSGVVYFCATCQRTFTAKETAFSHGCTG